MQLPTGQMRQKGRTKGEIDQKKKKKKKKRFENAKEKAIR